MCYSHFYRATEKHTHGIAIDILSVCLSVCLSNACIVTKRTTVCRYFNTVRYSNVSSFLRPNFVILRLGVHPERVRL